MSIDIDYDIGDDVAYVDGERYVRERTTTVDETWHVGFYMWNGERVTVHVMECSECGHTYEHVNGDYEFCPRCGRRIVREDQ